MQQQGCKKEEKAKRLLYMWEIDTNKGSKNVTWDLNGDKANIQGNSGLNVLRGVIGVKGF